MRSVLITVAGISLLVASAGCQMLTKQKQLENENAELKATLQQTTQQLEEATARNEKQDAALKECLEKHKQAVQKASDLEDQLVQLRKQWNSCRSGLAEQKAEAEMQKALAEKHHSQLEAVTKQLNDARERIRELEEQIDALKKKLAAGPQTQPSEP